MSADGLTSSVAAAAAAPPLLQMSGISKAFPGVQALRDVSLSVQRGEVRALLGENGAGKSTLIRMLGGAHGPDAGTIRIDGQPVVLDSPAAALRAGIGVIYQEFNLVPGLSACDNMFLGRERSRLLVSRQDELRRAQSVLERMGVSLPLHVPCRELSIAQQQLVEIARTLSQNVRILVLDEPSAALTPLEVQRLFRLLRELQAAGIGIIYISHRLDEVFELADTVTVLRDGQHVQDLALSGLTRQRLIELMVGRSIHNEFPRQARTPGAVRLQVTGLRRGTAVQDVSLTVRRGEVLGLTGLVGAGRTETLRLISGADRCEAGEILLDGQRLQLRDPRDAIRAGICLLTEDRKSQGLVLRRGIRENFSLASLRQFSTGGLLRPRAEQAALQHYAATLRIRMTDPDQPVGQLSGGNQQKVVLARWLQRNAEVLLFDEPTRGIDVGARQEIYRLINELAAQGKAILMVSSELPEVLGMSDRILVMHAGRITGEIRDVATATQAQIMALAVG